MILFILYTDLTEKFIYKYMKTYNVSYDEVVNFIRNKQVEMISYYVQEFFNISLQKEAYHYAELIKDDVLNNKPNKNKDNNPKINVSYIGCGSVSSRWQWGNDNGGPSCTGANRCWGTILGGNYVANMEDTLYSPVINASGYNNIVLRFRQWYYTESSYDQGFVLCSNDGGITWYQVAGPYQGTSGGWINTTINLPSQCQNTSQLRIAFRFKSDGSIQYYGWYIDDVVVENQNILSTTILYSSSFEGSNGDLNPVSISGLAPWQRGIPTSGPGSAYHGNEVWATNLSGNYNNNADEVIEKQTAISLSCAGCNNYYMRFYHWYETETGYDSGWVELNTGAGWFKFSPTYRGSNTVWSSVQLDLTPYSGSSIRFRFRFKSDGSIVYPGWYIDSVSIIGVNISSTTIVSYDFNANDGGWIATQSLSISDPYQLTNNYLEWYVDILSANDLGTYTARTGPAHPFGTISILYGTQFTPPSAWSSWTTIHVASSSRDYISKNGTATPLPGWSQFNLKNYANTIICENSPPRVTFVYIINNPPDNLTVKDIFWVDGTDANNSRLWHKTIVRNNAASPVSVGVRWEYDTHVNTTDHPAHFRCDYYPSLSLSCGPQITNEVTVNPVPNTFDFLRESDSDPPVNYHLFVVYGDGGSSLPITVPNFVQHIRWTDAHNNTWDQGVDGENISLSTGYDNAFNYFFNPVSINPNDSIIFQHFIGSPINPTPVNYDEIRLGNYRIKVYKTIDGFNIYYDGKDEIKVSIYDINGSLLKRINLKTGNNYIKIQKSGIYLIKGKNWIIKAIK